MNDLDFDTKVRNKIKNEVKIPENIENIVMNNVNLDSNKQRVKMSIKNKLIKFVQGIIAILSIFAVTGGVYAGLTGNSILSLLGLGKASIKFEEKSVMIGKTIDGDYTKTTLNRIACDGSFIILEYEIEIKDSMLEMLKDSGKSDTFSIEGNITSVELGNANKSLNGGRVQEYAKYSEKIEDNRFMYYEIISIANKDFSSLKLTLPVSTLIINGIDEIDITKTIYHEEGDFIEYEDRFYVDMTITEDAENSMIKEIPILQKSEGDYDFILDRVCSTDFGVFAIATVKVHNISKGEENKTSLRIAMSDEEKCDNLRTILLRNQITTEHDELIDLIHDIPGDNEVFRNMDDYNPDNEPDWTQINYSDGNAELKYMLIFPNETEDDSFVVDLKEMLYESEGQTLIKDIEIKDIGKISYNITINELGTKMSDVEDYTKYLANDNQGTELENPYYNPEAEKIDLYKFDICGFMLGMSYEDTMDNLNRLYATEEVIGDEEEFVEDDVLLDDPERDISNFDEFTFENYNSYSDDNFTFDFYKDRNGTYRLTRVGCFNISYWNGGNTTENDIISRYYSKPNYVFNDGLYQEKILYGEEERKKAQESSAYEHEYGDYAYILVMDDKDYNVCYYDSNNKANVFVNFDSMTKKVTEIDMQLVEAQYR